MTRKHVSRFLATIDSDITYSDVKNAISRVKGNAVSICDNKNRIELGADYLDRWVIMPYEDAVGLLKNMYESIKPFTPWI